MTILMVSEADIDDTALFYSEQDVLHRKTGGRMHQRQKESLNLMWRWAFGHPAVEAGFKVREEAPHSPQRPKNPRRNSKE